MDTLAKRERFFQVASDRAFFLDADVQGVSAYLAKRDWLERGEFVLSAKIAGQGNMNYLVRVTTISRSFILKQSRPWVEKYSDIAAPFDRALFEAAFYVLLDDGQAGKFMPAFYWVDEESRILCLEDLGASRDFTDVYSAIPVLDAEVEQLCRYLSLLHSTKGRLRNREMRELNHFHIFTFPFEPTNNFDLNRITPGLQPLADEIKRDHRLKARIAELGDLYLADGRFLLHGDYFPGSWLRNPSGVKVIDPEFGFSGLREFDFGVMLAHLRMCGKTDALQCLAGSYAQWNDLDEDLVRGFAGTEMLRRLLGVAQLPLPADINQKRLLLEEAAAMVLA